MCAWCVCVCMCVYECVGCVCVCLLEPKLKITQSGMGGGVNGCGSELLGVTSNK